MTGRILGFLSSGRLALALLLLLAASAIPGTLASADTLERAELYRHPVFLTLMVALCLNIAVCSWRRFQRRRGSPRGRTVVLLDLALHLSVLLVLAGGLGKSLWGFIGTQYLFVGVETDEVHDWKRQEDVPLGFGLLLQEIKEEFYPLRLKIGVRDLETGAKVALVELVEESEEEVPGTALRLTATGYERGRGSFSLVADEGERKKTIGFSLGGIEKTTAAFGDYSFAVVAYRSDLKKVFGRIALVEEGEAVKEEWLGVNSRLVHGGTSVFLTSWGEDAYRNAFLGVQVSRDPWAPLFWAGCALLSLSVPLFFYYRRGRGS